MPGVTFDNLRDVVMSCKPGEHVLVDPRPTTNGQTRRCERCGVVVVDLKFRIDPEELALS